MNMKKHIAEESALFVSVLKWALLASVVGAVVGASTALFLKALGLASGYASSLSWYWLLPPLALMLSNLSARLIDPEAAGEGLDKVIDSVHSSHGRIRLTVAPAKFIASIFTIAGGGSAGKEAPPVQVAGAIVSTLARALKFDRDDRRKLVICSISAGFASVFGAPIAGAVFGIESLFLGQLMYDVLLPSLIAGIVAHQVSLGLDITYFTEQIRVVPDFTGGLFAKVILAGIMFGLVSLLLIEAMRLSGRAFRRLPVPFAVKGLVAGAILSLATLALGDARYLGLGIETIEGAATGASVPAYSFLVKIALTAVTLGSGASGGIITPIFFIGATSGSVFGELMGFDPATFAAVGMVAVLAGAANTPVAAGILAMELFGVRIGPWAATAAVVSYLMTGNRSIHESQVVAGLKSASVVVPHGGKVGDAEASVRVREKSVLGIAKGVFKKK